MNPLQTRWHQLARRERHLVVLALVLVAGAGFWLGLLGPALRTLRDAPAQHQALDRQLQTMLHLQAQARDLQQQAPLSLVDTQRAVSQATQQVLGSTALISQNANRMTITLRGSSPEALALWLGQVRANARLTPHEARLTRQSLANGTRWSGTVVFEWIAR